MLLLVLGALVAKAEQENRTEVGESQGLRKLKEADSDELSHDRVRFSWPGDERNGFVIY